MDLESVRVFVEVARAGSFAAVARSRNVAPSSIARIISGLEAELVTRLIQRTTRRLNLTEAGHAYLARVEALVEEFDLAREGIVSGTTRPTGLLRITASQAFGFRLLGPLIPKFAAIYPELGVELLLTDVNMDLVADRVDLAVRLGPATDASLIGTRLFTTRYRVCAATAYLKKAATLRRPSDLAAHPSVLLNLPKFRNEWKFRRVQGQEHVVPVHGNLITSSILTLREWAIEGAGPALLPSWLIEPDLRSRRLTDLFPKWQVAATDFDTAAWLLYPSRRYVPNKVRCMIDFLRAEFQPAAR
jgi:DNA-binding transcriptional LysR family regulator